jgi:GNAT superfamily N-acetyltransferase
MAPDAPTAVNRAGLLPIGDDTAMPDPTPEPAALAEPEIHIRPARPADAAGVADVYLSAYRATYDFPLAHSDDEVRDWLRGYTAGGRVWVALAVGGEEEARGSRGGAVRPSAAADLVVGFIGLDGHEVDQLYIRPGWWGRGIGSRLIELASSAAPEGLALWTLVNARARRFYNATHNGRDMR